MEITAREIVYSIGMSARPEFYSGRGAVWYDLSGDKLFQIHSKIKEKIGTKQAAAFVTMVENLSELSATNFLNALYSLEANDWEYHPVSESNIDVGPDGYGRMPVAMATIGTSLFNLGRDDTDFIRDNFFAKIGYRGKNSKKESDIDFHYYYSY